MLTVSRMKSFLNLSPTLSNNVTTPFSCCFHYEQSIILRKTSRNMHAAKSLQSPNFLSRISVMRSLVNCAKPSNCNRIRSLHTEATSRSGEIHVIVGPMFAGKTTTLIRRIKLESSNGSFQANAIKNSINLDKTLKGLCLTGRVSEAIGILCRTGVKVESGTYSLLLQECIFRKAYTKGRRIHWQMTVAGFVPDEYLNVKLMIFYAKAGDLDTAHILFDNLLVKTLISWNAMIAGYVQKGTEEVGLCFYYRMRQCGFIPDQYTFASVFRACASLAILEQGKQAHAVLIKSQISENIVVTSALMDMYFKCSSLCDGFRVFDKSLGKNVITWTSLISGYGQHGKVFEVLEYFHQMINEGFRPNQITFLAVLTACSHGGLVDEGQEYFSSMMRDYDVQPRGKHYAAVVDLLGRAGRLIEAYKFVENSPCKEHPAIWGALLGACKIHGNVDMIKLAAKNFFELEPENAGKYIVLSNAYATFGLWSNVAEIRSIMKESGIKKEPGYSMIEVQAEAHFFFMGDNIHKQTEQIYELIKDMACILKDTGDIPDLSI